MQVMWPFFPLTEEKRPQHDYRHVHACAHMCMHVCTCMHMREFDVNNPFWPPILGKTGLLTSNWGQVDY